MKIISRNLLLFAALFLIYTVLFRYGLGSLLIWSGFLILHFILFLILRKRTIKGVHKTDIFESTSGICKEVLSLIEKTSYSL